MTDTAPAYQNKLVFVGHVGAGKTTAIGAICDGEPVSTEMPMDEAVDGKRTSTMALDYASVELGDGELLHVYGVPGQRYLDFMWPIVCEGAMGIVVLANAAEPDAGVDLPEMLSEFSQLAPDASFVVGITHGDQVPDFHLADVRERLLARGYAAPMLQVDARDAVQVELLVRTLLGYRFTGDRLPG